MIESIPLRVFARIFHLHFPVLSDMHLVLQIVAVMRIFRNFLFEPDILKNDFREGTVQR